MNLSACYKNNCAPILFLCQIIINNLEIMSVISSSYKIFSCDIENRKWLHLEFVIHTIYDQSTAHVNLKETKIFSILWNEFQWGLLL